MIKKFLRKIVLKEKASSESYIKYLRNIGVSIGDDVIIYSPSNSLIDITQPCLLKIGNHVRITRGVIILTHDYSWSVLKSYEDSECLAGGIFGAQSPVNIGDNVFIGMNSVITRGVTIGNNVIIGAGSIVTKDCEPDSVYAGNPAKRIMSVAEYRKKREQKQFEEAKVLARTYYETYNKKPDASVFREYFILFCSAKEAEKNEEFRAQMATNCNFEATVAYMNSQGKKFSNFEEFLEACFTD